MNSNSNRAYDELSCTECYGLTILSQWLSVTWIIAVTSLDTDPQVIDISESQQLK